MLFEYLRQARRFIRDANMAQIAEEDLISYCNRVRREVAGRTQCVRVLTPISAPIVTIAVVEGGTGYTAPIVEITPPDAPSGTRAFPLGAQATATATVVAGAITAINVTYGGDGYFQPQVTISDPTGSGAVLSAATTPTNLTQNGQEIYAFQDIDLSRYPGVGQIFAVKSVSILYENYRYSLSVYSFSTYQAKVRQYPYQYYYVPTIGAQYGQGTNGSFFLYPISSQPFQMEWDCFCLPIDLTSDQSVEAIPQPWQDCIPWGMASLAYAELQNLNSAEYYSKKLDDYIHKYSGIARPGRASNIYGRWIVPLLLSVSFFAGGVC